MAIITFEIPDKDLKFAFKEMLDGDDFPKLRQDVTIEELTALTCILVKWYVSPISMIDAINEHEPSLLAPIIEN